MHTITKASGF